MSEPIETIPGVLIRAAARNADGVALREADSVWTNADLLEDVRCASRAFMAAGLQKGDVFAVWAPNSAEWIIAALGGQMAGGILVPLNTRYKGAEAEDILRRSKARLLFTVRDFLGTDYPDLLAGADLPALEQTICLREGGQVSGQWRAFLERGDAISEAALDQRFSELGPDDLCDVLYTSGTTGKPKGVMTTHGQNVAVFTEWGRTVGLAPGDVYLIVNPFFHAFGYKAGWLAAMIWGAEILPRCVFDSTQLLHDIETWKVNVLPGPPTIFQSLLNDPKLGDFDISSLSKTITGAASVPENLVYQMKEVLGFTTVLTGYGLTEATGVVSLSRAGDNVARIANFSGRPLEGVEVRVLGPDGREVPAGQPGEIMVRGFNVMKGYLDDPQATADAITSDGWLKTGDIGFADAEGYLKITGRAKDMFITGGFNCYPAEIEDILLTHPDILDAAVVGDPDERLGEVCHAHLVVRNKQCDPDAIIAWAREKMANFKVPRKITFHDVLPRNAGGKVQKFLLSADVEISHNA